MKRKALLLCAVVCWLVALSVAGQSGSRGVVEDQIPLKDWSVPFEQVRAKVMETEPLRIAERSLHPSTNSVPSAASHFITIVPCRVADTRLGNGPYGGPKLVGGTARTFNVPGGPCTGIPTTAAAYSLNFTVLNGEGSSGFLTAYPTGATKPTVSTLNYGIGNLVANAAIVPAGTSASIDVYVNYNVDIIIDINGYFVEGVVTNIATGTGLTGGGTGAVLLDVAPNGVGASQLAANAVTTGAIQNNAVTAAKIASGQVVKSLNGATDAVTITGANGLTVSTSGNTVQVAGASPTGSMILGYPADTTLIGAGYTEIGPSPVESWRVTSLTNAPSLRAYHTAAWTGTKMIVWGGSDASSYLNTGGQYDPATDSWTAMATTNAPAARGFPTSVWAGSAGVIIVWGGGNPGYLNTGGQYNPATNTWTQTNTFGAPAPRFSHIAVWTGTYMVVWGGYNGAFLNSGARYRPVQDDWAPTSLTSAPTGRETATAVWTGSLMIVWGGFDGNAATGNTNTGGRYDPNADTWSPTSTTGAPTTRDAHAAVWTGPPLNKMIVWGGYSGGFPNTGGVYDPNTDTWTATSTTGAPAGRYFQTGVWNGQKLIIWGGYNNVVEFNNGAQYDPSTDTWSAPLSLINAPTARQRHTAVWANNRMIVWGGLAGNGTTYFNTGGQWAQLSLYQKN